MHSYFLDVYKTFDISKPQADSDEEIQCTPALAPSTLVKKYGKPQEKNDLLSTLSVGKTPDGEPDSSHEYRDGGWSSSDGTKPDEKNIHSSGADDAQLVSATDSIYCLKTASKQKRAHLIFCRKSPCY